MARQPEKPQSSTPEKTGTDTKTEKPTEVGGPRGLEPTRYGDWERKGIVSDF